MGRDSNMDYDVRAGSFFSGFTDTQISIIEMTAGILVCCMPTTSAVFKRCRLHFSTYGSSAALNKSSRMNARNNDGGDDKEEDGASDAQPIYQIGSHRTHSEGSGNAREIWTGPMDASNQWHIEHDLTFAIPLQDASIRKTTQIDVNRETQRA